MKAHSERVKNKNFRMFAGKPLYRWVLDTLLEVQEISQVIINTDARSLLKDTGLEESERVVIRDRKPELCGDFVSMNLILQDDIDNVDADTYLMTHTTNPLLSSATIRGAIERYNRAREAGDGDSLFTVTKYQTRFYRQDGSPVNHDPNELIRTQDLEPWYEENSNLYVFSKESFAKTSARIGESPILMETRPIESVDIDDPESWELAEAIAAHTLGQGGKETNGVGG